jgi:hypothetical protein
VKKQEPPEYDIIGAVRAVDRGMSVSTASSQHHLSAVQREDLQAHVDAWARVRRGEMPALTPFERASVVKYYTPAETPPSWHIRRKHTPVRILVQVYEYAACAASAEVN